MKTNRRIISKKLAALFSAGSFLFFIFVFVAPSAQAATSTVRGVGWWGDTLGNVYFNCLDDVIGDRFDDPQNLSGSGRYSPPNDKFHFFSAPCSNLVHGVYINDNDNFFGQAWNPDKGLISFSGTTTPPDGYGDTSSHCAHTCNSSNSCWACYSKTDQKIYGWARVDSDGTWLKLSSSLTPPVSLQDCGQSSVWPGYNIQAGDFAGYASSAIGNLSFNCESESGGSACATRNYKVYISNLTIGSLSAPNWTYAQACSSTALGANLRWCKRSGTQTAYEIAVSTNNSLSTSTAICWSGKKNSSFSSQYILPNSDPACGSLNYNSNYYWWVRLYDENDIPTDWFQYNSNSASDTDGNRDNNASTFSTYLHEFPTPFFTWSPYEVLVGTSTFFSGLTSRYYTSGAPNSPQNCSNATCRYLWTTSDFNVTISPDNIVTTTIIFDLATGTTVTLKATDNDNYYCSSSTVFRINYDLPIWREIKAK